VKAVIAVHYFGFPERIREIREICNAFGLVLIEDCAHVLTGMTDGGRLGSFGDASVFSWRKVLPVYDGADLIIRAPVVNPLPPMVRQPLYLELRTVFNLISRAATQERSSVFLRKCMQLAGWVASRRPRLKSENAIHPEMSAVDFSSSLLGLPMSTVSTQLLQHSDLARIALQRRNNYCYLARCLAGIPRVRLLYPELPERICPWILPLVFEGMTGAHLTLRRRGIPAVTWGEVRPRQLRDGDFPEAQHLYDNLVFLPIHQDLTLSDMERISREAGKITALNA
jgi:dTDP-4-amino-4,6-dideoxygalactose transaminase